MELRHCPRMSSMYTESSTRTCAVTVPRASQPMAIDSTTLDVIEREREVCVNVKATIFEAMDRHAGTGTSALSWSASTMLILRSLYFLQRAAACIGKEHIN